MLQAFFEDKDAEVYVQRLQTIHKQGTKRLDKDGLRTLIEGPATPAPPPEPERHAEPAQPAPSPAPPERANGPVPLWKQFRQDTPPLAEQVATGVRQTSTRQAPPTEEGVPRWKQFRSENSSPEPTAPVPPSRPSQAAVAPASSSDLATMEQTVLGHVGAHNRDLFIRHLFNGDRTDYAQVLDRLDAAATWTDASKIIASEVFRKNQVNIYSDPAVLFTDAVEARYRA